MAHRVDRILSHVVQSTPIESVATSAVSSVFHEGILRGQVAIITGSGQGIGEAAARLFSQEGAKVVITDIDKAKSDNVAAGITQSGGIAASFPGDVTNPAFAEDIMSFTIKTFGKLNILVNNAGFTWDGMIHKMTDKQWDKIIDVHITAPFRLIRAATPYMREASKNENDKGLTVEPRCILNVSSTSGLHGNIGQINYSTAKMGILGMTKTVAREWGSVGIRCNCIAFGSIKTRLTAEKANQVMQIDANTKVTLGIPKAILEARPQGSIPGLGRAGEPIEAARAMLFLCSPLASYVNGHCLEVTGGSNL